MVDRQARAHVRVAAAFPEERIDDPVDLGAVYERYRDLLLGRCEATLGDPDVAADTLQDAFLAALTELRDGASCTVRQLARTARQMAYHRARQARRDRGDVAGPDELSASRDPGDLLDTRALVELVWDGFTGTERDYVRQALAGYTHDEIGRERRRAAGTVAAMLHQARRRARRLRDGLPAVLPLMRWKADGLARRTRDRVGDAASVAQGAVTGSVSEIAATLIAALSVAALAAPAAGAPGGAAVVAAVVHSDDRASPSATSAVAPGGGAGGADRSVRDVGRPPARSDGLAGGVALLAPPNTPEETRLSAAAASPDYRNDHTVIALGLAPSCSCSVLFRSSDGGASWQASPVAAPSGSQVVLPPDYPRDSRIFVANVASGLLPDYVAPSFGAAFRQLQVPPGLLALSPLFDRGDPRAFVAATGALWAYDVESGVAHPAVVVSDPATPAFPITVRGGGAGAVLAVAPTSSFAVGAGGAAAPSATAGVPVYACPPAATQPCTVRSRLPWPEPGWLATASSGAAPVLLAGFGSTLMASTDEGTSFHALATPAATAAVSTAGVSAPSGSATEIWLATAGTDGAHHISRSLLASLNWSDADGGGLPDLAHAGALMVLSPLRALYLMPSRGLRCTVDGGRTWADRCSAPEGSS